MIDCTNKNLSWETLVRMLATVSDDDCPALRIIDSSPVVPTTNFQQRPDGSYRLRPDGSKKVRP